jgi:hypothetical protein
LTGNDTIEVVDVKWITDVVGMVPFQRPGSEQGEGASEEFFAVEKMATAYQVGAVDSVEDDE